MDRLAPEPASRLGAASPGGVLRVFGGQIREHLVALRAREEKAEERCREPGEGERPAQVNVLGSVHTLPTSGFLE